jgi:hypothetical protein
MFAALIIIIIICSSLVCASLEHDDFFCPYKEETLYYNIDITIDNVGVGCESYDLYNIGIVLQEIVHEVEEEIPSHRETERMDTTICPVPLSEEERRRRNLWETALVDEEQRDLAKRRRKKNGQYTYKGGGRCRRCRKNNSDRRSLGVGDACAMVNPTDNAVNVISDSVKKAHAAFMLLKERALECNHLEMGMESVLVAKALLEKCRKTLKVARKAANQVVSESPASTISDRGQSNHKAGQEGKE